MGGKEHILPRGRAGENRRHLLSLVECQKMEVTAAGRRKRNDRTAKVSEMSHRKVNVGKAHKSMGELTTGNQNWGGEKRGEILPNLKREGLGIIEEEEKTLLIYR